MINYNGNFKDQSLDHFNNRGFLFGDSHHATSWRTSLIRPALLQSFEDDGIPAPKKPST